MENEKYSVQEFASKIKDKFPEYKDMSDVMATKAHLQKYEGDVKYLKPFSQKEAEEFKTQVPEVPKQPTKMEVSIPEAFGQGLRQGATFNLGEEIGIQQPEEMRAASTQQPLSYTAGEIVGGLPYDYLATQALGPLGALSRTPRYARMIERLPALRNLIGPTAMEAGKGFLSGVGGGEEGNRLQSGLVTGTLSAAIPAGISRAPESLGRLANYLGFRGMMPTASQLEKLRIKSGAAAESAPEAVQRLGGAARELGLTSPFQSGATRLTKIQDEATKTGLLPEASMAKTQLLSQLEEAGAKGYLPEDIMSRIQGLPKQLNVTTPTGEVRAFRAPEINPAMRKIQSTLEQYKQARDVYQMKPPEVSYQPPRMPVSGDIPTEKITEQIPIPLSEMDKLAADLYNFAQLDKSKKGQLYRGAAKNIREMVQEGAEPVAQQLGRGGELAESNRRLRDLIQLQQLTKTQAEKEATLSPISWIPTTLSAGATMASGGDTSDYARNVLLANLLLRGRGYRAGSNIAGGAERAMRAVDPLAEALSRRIGVQNLSGPVTRAIVSGE